MDKERCSILYLEKKQEKRAEVELCEQEDTVSIKLLLEELVIEKTADNFFDALIEIRKETEAMDIKLLCKGCSKNVYPSGMLLSMGPGRKAYTLTYGEQAKLSSLVDIFDSCSIEEYGSIDEQSESFEDWIKSLQG